MFSQVYVKSNSALLLLTRFLCRRFTEADCWSKISCFRFLDASLWWNIVGIAPGTRSALNLKPNVLANRNLSGKHEGSKCLEHKTSQSFGCQSLFVFTSIRFTFKVHAFLKALSLGKEWKLKGVPSPFFSWHPTAAHWRGIVITDVRSQNAKNLHYSLILILRCNIQMYASSILSFCICEWRHYMSLF